MRVLVCGSRTYDDAYTLSAVLCGLLALRGDDPDFIVIEGECPYGGADLLARYWAEEWGKTVERYPPKNRTAEEYHARNRAMVDSGVDLCVAFLDKPFSHSKGTRYTVEYARSKKVKTILVRS